jgi:16S rRNA (cytosine1402-N4)-methyltransferase
MLQPAVEALKIDPSGIYLDVTFGRGGHSRKIMEKLGERGLLIAVDRDPQAVVYAVTLFGQDSRFRIVQENFAMLADVAQQQGVIGQVNGILMDLGVSSPQLDQPKRGFSFIHDGPLDMRMDATQDLTAAKWLEQAQAKEITKVLKEYGEERYAKRIAQAIVEARSKGPINTTGHLAELISCANPSWEKGKHPATRSFQAIRIFINNELDALNKSLESMVDVLAPGGRLAVISFHSLEDRIVKRFMRDQAKGERFPHGVPVTDDQRRPRLKLIGKAIRPDNGEIRVNPRARSAVLRVAERC